MTVQFVRESSPGVGIMYGGRNVIDVFVCEEKLDKQGWCLEVDCGGAMFG